MQLHHYNVWFLTGYDFLFIKDVTSIISFRLHFECDEKHLYDMNYKLCLICAHLKVSIMSTLSIHRQELSQNQKTIKHQEIKPFVSHYFEDSMLHAFLCYPAKLTAWRTKV